MTIEPLVRTQQNSQQTNGDNYGVLHVVLRDVSTPPRRFDSSVVASKGVPGGMNTQQSVELSILQPLVATVVMLNPLASQQMGAALLYCHPPEIGRFLIGLALVPLCMDTPIYPFTKCNQSELAKQLARPDASHEHERTAHSTYFSPQDHLAATV